ncbi:hypothetical protein BDY21DRAFT_345817 [Lineolata rhizophorae]|uniref:Uncharacterized protein n=1 Tax=Lineolata rhizophorae TaxID=578093 RepID=A0A6A6NY78_9PEZI|nr:hypothetical protein BDY21DRAFT_345817 [Lineolata rhizophorae]
MARGGVGAKVSTVLVLFLLPFWILARCVCHPRGVSRRLAAVGWYAQDRLRRRREHRWRPACIIPFLFFTSSCRLFGFFLLQPF